MLIHEGSCVNKKYKILGSCVPLPQYVDPAGPGKFQSLIDDHRSKRLTCGLQPYAPSTVQGLVSAFGGSGGLAGRRRRSRRVRPLANHVDGAIGGQKPDRVSALAVAGAERGRISFLG